MESPEPGPPHGPWQLGNDAGYGCCYEHSARGTAGEDGARGPEHLPPLRPALSSSSSEGEPAAARRREPSLSDEAGGGYEFDSAESGTSLRYSTGGEGSEGAGLASSESGGSGFSLAASALPERKRPRSADGGGRPRYEVVRELGPEEVRWLYREDRKSWKPFIGYDSLRLELAYRALGPGDGPGPPVCVRGGLYEVDVSSAECYPVYWQPGREDFIFSSLPTYHNLGTCAMGEWITDTVGPWLQGGDYASQPENGESCSLPSSNCARGAEQEQVHTAVRWGRRQCIPAV